MMAAHSKWWQGSNTMVGLFLPATILLSWFLPLPMNALLDNPWFQKTGYALLIVGLGFIRAATWHFEKDSQPIGPGHSTTELLTTGVFRFSRNPIYLGIILTYSGVGLVLCASWFLIFAGLMVVVANKLYIQPEENYLEEEFGERYQAYRSSVRRWI